MGEPVSEFPDSTEIYWESFLIGNRFPIVDAYLARANSELLVLGRFEA